MKTYDEIRIEAVAHALNGGRKFGSAEHRKMFEYIGNALIDGEIDAATLGECAGKLGNQSALQQSLASGGFIDRNERGVVKKAVWDALKAK